MGMNSGYEGWSMSKRAAAAYENGEKPKSKWTKKAMVEALRDYCYEHKLCYRDEIDKMKKDEIFENYFEYTGWHHTSKYCNETDFYGINEDVVREELAIRSRWDELLVSLREAEWNETRARKEAKRWANLASRRRSVLEKYRQKTPHHETAWFYREARKMREEAADSYYLKYGFYPWSFSAYALTFPDRVTYLETLSGHMMMVCSEKGRVRKEFMCDVMKSDCPFFSEKHNALDYQDEFPIEPPRPRPPKGGKS